jgi:hypothetical protein
MLKIARFSHFPFAATLFHAAAKAPWSFAQHDVWLLAPDAQI